MNNNEIVVIPNKSVDWGEQINSNFAAIQGQINGIQSSLNQCTNNIEEYKTRRMYFDDNAKYCKIQANKVVFFSDPKSIFSYTYINRPNINTIWIIIDNEKNNNYPINQFLMIKNPDENDWTNITNFYLVPNNVTPYVYKLDEHSIWPRLKYFLTPDWNCSDIVEYDATVLIDMTGNETGPFSAEGRSITINNFNPKQDYVKFFQNYNGITKEVMIEYEIRTNGIYIPNFSTYSPSGADYYCIVYQAGSNNIKEQKNA